METIDLSVILTASISFISIVVNAVITYINHRTTIKTHQMELEARQKEKILELSYGKKADVFHCFFQTASDFMCSPGDPEIYKKFSEAYCQALMYCSDDAMQTLRYFYESVSNVYNSDDKSSSQFLTNGIISCAYDLRDCILPDPSLYRINKSSNSPSEHY